MSPAAAGRDNGRAVPGDGEGKAARAQRAGDRRRDTHTHTHTHTYTHTHTHARTHAGFCQLIISLTAAFGSGDISSVRPADALPASLHPVLSPAVRSRSCALPPPLSPLFPGVFPAVSANALPEGRAAGGATGLGSARLSPYQKFQPSPPPIFARKTD